MGQIINGLIAKFGNPMKALEFQRKNCEVYQIPDWLVAHFPKYNGVPVRKISMHKAMIKPFDKVMRALVSNGLIDQLTTYDGCIVVRLQRGSIVVSMHAFGLAIDFNAASGGLGQTREQLIAKGHTPFTEAFLQIWRENGFRVGADFKPPRTDFMHFEFIPK